MRTRKEAMLEEESLSRKQYYNPDEHAGTMLFCYMVFFIVFVAPYFLLGK